MTVLTINGYDVADLGFEVTHAIGQHTGAPWAWQRIEQPRRPGAVPIARRLQSRPVEVRGYVHGSYADRTAAVRALQSVCTRRQPCELVYVDGSGGWRLEADFRGLTVDEDQPARWASQYWDVQLAFVAERMPLWQSTTQTVIAGIGSNPVALPQGNGPAWPIMWAEGPCEDPEFYLLDADDQEVGHMKFHLAVPDGEILVVDCAHYTAYVNTTGQPRDGDRVIHLWSAGHWIEIQPQHFNDLAEHWPKAKILNATGRFIYTRTRF